MVADEEDIIGYNVLHLLAQGVRGIIVADNLSTDRTPDILSELEKLYPGRVVVVQDKDPAYYQATKMTALASWARDLGADYILPFDADELIYSFNEGFTVAEAIIWSGANVIGIPMWNHFCTGRDAESPNPFVRMCWRSKHQNPLDKVAFRYRPDVTLGGGNHTLLEEGGSPHPGRSIGLGIRHFAYRSADHFVRKADRGGRALAATTLPMSFGAHWRQYKQSLDEGGPEALKEHYRKWFTCADPTETMLYDPAPYSGDSL